MATRNLVQTVAIKGEDGLLGNDFRIGAGFEDIIDSRIGRGNYSLAQFFDNYTSFMKNSFFVDYGIIPPSNTHIPIWIDTSSTNQDGFPTETQNEENVEEVPEEDSSQEEEGQGE